MERSTFSYCSPRKEKLLAHVLKKEVTLDTSKYNEIREICIQGVKVKGSLSPYDLPRQADISYNDSSKEYKIHFVYLTPDEPKSEQKVSQIISLFLGQSSGKLYDIVVRAQELVDLQHIRFQLISEVGALAEQSEKAVHPNYIKEFNLLAAKRMLEEEPLYELVR